MSLYADPAFQALTPDVWRPGGLKLTTRGLKLCGWPSGALVADVGAGPGGTVRLLQDLGLRVLALDRSYDENCPPCARTCAFQICADACRLPLADASLDGLVCECVLSLLPEPKAAVSEFARVLRPGGRALVSDLTVRDLSVYDPAALPRSTLSCAQGALDPQHMAAWFAEAGLRVLTVEDHREALRALAAQMLWHGIGCGDMCRSRSLGYHLWIVEKESV